MDDDKHEINSESDEIEKSSTNGDHTNKHDSAEEDYGAATQENDPARVLQLSQPFFAADTLEEDESMIIPPTQEDSVPFLIPSTPIIADKGDKKSVQLDESSITVLEETCGDLEESKSDHNDSSKEDVNETANTSCMENDLTQDLSELDVTQPLLPSKNVQKDSTKESNDAKDEKKDEDDDEWQLKFSESQTQDLLQFQKVEDGEDEDIEMHVKESESFEPCLTDHLLPDTSTINIDETPRLEEKCSLNDTSIKSLESSDHLEEVEAESDDEIEPSQSCLSRYKGETISYNRSLSADAAASVEEISKSNSEKKLSVEEIDKNDEDVEGKNEVFASEPKSSSILASKEDIPNQLESVEIIEEIKNYKKMDKCFDDMDAVKELEEHKETNDDVIEIFKEKPLSEPSNDTESVKICSEIEVVDTIEQQLKEVNKIADQRMEVDGEESIKVVEETDEVLEAKPVEIKSSKSNVEEIKDKEKMKSNEGFGDETIIEEEDGDDIIEDDKVVSDDVKEIDKDNAESMDMKSDKGKMEDAKGEEHIKSNEGFGGQTIELEDDESISEDVKGIEKDESIDVDNDKSKENSLQMDNIETKLDEKHMCKDFKASVAKTLDKSKSDLSNEFEAKSNLSNKEVEAESDLSHKVKAKSVILNKMETESDIPKEVAAESDTHKNVEEESDTHKDVEAESGTHKDIEAESNTSKDIEAKTVILKQTEAESDISKQVGKKSDLPKELEEKSDLAKEADVESDLPKETEAKSDLPKETVAESILPKKTKIELNLPKYTRTKIHLSKHGESKANLKFDSDSSPKVESQTVLRPGPEFVGILDSEPGESQPYGKSAMIDKSETPPASMLPPQTTFRRGFGSMQKQKFGNKNVYHSVSPIEKSDKIKHDPRHCIRSFKDIKSIERFFTSLGINFSHELAKTLLQKSGDEVEIKTVFSVVDQKIYLKEYSVEFDQHNQNTGVSPISSSSTATSSTVSSIKTGEMADISSSTSGGSHLDSVGQSMTFLSSQDTGVENFPKTSTQITQGPIGLSEVFGKKESAEEQSPIRPDLKQNTKSVKSTAQKRKRGKKNGESSTTEGSSVEPPKRKRGKGPKSKAPVEKVPDESKDSGIHVKPRKATRRKKVEMVVPDSIKIATEDIEMPADEDTGINQDAGNFGLILPGVKVMARWKDGYYYSGKVQSLLDGKWSVLFEDNFLRTIAPENLIKIAILPKGTSVLVQSPDDFYDPGIVCGHFREGDKVGYEVELDNGVTRRYPRSSVILSSDQAKLITSSRPPTTPSSKTINLDNIVDGKRKRKSVQSPVSSPVVKKSPRITRSKKPDSNLDSTAESSAAEFPKVQEPEITDVEEPIKKKKRVRKGAKSTSSATTSDTSNSSTDKTVTTVASLPQRPIRNTKLFKDYAFLLTNADRKIIPKLGTSDSDTCSRTEEDDIVPFDKDELCSYIASGGGIILDKFDDIKKCNRKHIYLLANSYLRTMKYIQCIAAAINCVKHHWVQNCVFKGDILGLSSYILPSGFCLVTQEVIEWHGKMDVFKGLKISLVSAPESPFVYTWAPVLLAAKADFVQKFSLPSSGGTVSGCSLIVDVLITNNHCPLDIIHSAKKRKIPIVSSEWIIQCLIMGKRLPYDAHPKFKFDYTEI